MAEIQPDRLRYALETVLYQLVPDAEDLSDLCDLLLDEALRAGVHVSTDAALDTLSDVESHPLVGVLAPLLNDYLQTSQTILLLADILDLYAKPADLTVTYEPLAKIDHCEICERNCRLTVHHLIPRSEHALISKRKLFSIEECRTRLAYVCRPCHNAIHRCKSNRELGAEFNTVERLLELPEIERHARWCSKQKF